MSKLRLNVEPVSVAEGKEQSSPPSCSERSDISSEEGSSVPTTPQAEKELFTTLSLNKCHQVPLSNASVEDEVNTNKENVGGMHKVASAAAAAAAVAADLNSKSFAPEEDGHESGSTGRRGCDDESSGGRTNMKETVEDIVDVDVVDDIDVDDEELEPGPGVKRIRWADLVDGSVEKARHVVEMEESEGLEPGEVPSEAFSDSEDGNSSDDHLSQNLVGAPATDSEDDWRDFSRPSDAETETSDSEHDGEDNDVSSSSGSSSDHSALSSSSSDDDTSCSESESEKIGLAVNTDVGGGSLVESGDDGGDEAVVGEAGRATCCDGDDGDGEGSEEDPWDDFTCCGPDEWSRRAASMRRRKRLLARREAELEAALASAVDGESERASPPSSGSEQEEELAADGGSLSSEDEEVDSIDEDYPQVASTKRNGKGLTLMVGDSEDSSSDPEADVVNVWTGVNRRVGNGAAVYMAYARDLHPGYRGEWDEDHQDEPDGPTSFSPPLSPSSAPRRF